MPAAFDKCVKDGGQVRTVSGPNKDQGLKAGEYMHVCIAQNGGRFWGEKKKKKMKKSHDVKIRITKTIKTILLEDITSSMLDELQTSDLTKIHAILHKLWNESDVSKKQLLDSHRILLEEFAGRNIEHSIEDDLDTLETRLKNIELEEIQES
jgi:hypothetical protein